MKRSEMIDLIYDVLIECNADFSWGDTRLSVAEDVLTKIEQAGMLPPERTISEPYKNISVPWEQEHRSRSWQPEEALEEKESEK